VGKCGGMWMCRGIWTYTLCQISSTTSI